MIFNSNKERNNPYKIYYLSFIIGAFFILSVSIRNILVLGPDFIDQLYFPSYAAVSVINIGNFLQRIEVVVAVDFLFSGFVKISVCLMSVCKGIDSFLKIGNYRQIVAPVGFLMMITSCIIYQSTMEMVEWANKVYRYYAFPFQVILPVIIWVAAEIKTRQQRRGNV
jgi:spore germination protein KB